MRRKTFLAPVFGAEKTYLVPSLNNLREMYPFPAKGGVKNEFFTPPFLIGSKLLSTI